MWGMCFTGGSNSKWPSCNNNFFCTYPRTRCWSDREDMAPGA